MSTNQLKPRELDVNIDKRVEFEYCYSAWL